jgi:hypothetical protein
MKIHIIRRLMVAASLLLAACSGNSDYLAVAGGGFIFNYRIAEAKYGIALKPMRELPEHGVVEATFENPSGGDSFVVRKEGPFNPTRIALETPQVSGVVKNHPYKVRVVLSDETGKALQTIERTYKSELDQTVLPDKPLAIGPGYQKNIDASDSAYPPSVGSVPPAKP